MKLGSYNIHLFSADLHCYEVAEDMLAECVEVLVEEEVDPPLIGAALIVSQGTLLHPSCQIMMTINSSSLIKR